MERIVNTSEKTAYYVGDPQDYRSMYGYKKRWYAVHAVKPGQTAGSADAKVGCIKEEAIADENGDVVTVVFYTKDFVRPSGMIRFFASPEALLIAFGLQPLIGRSEEEQKIAQKKVKALTETKPSERPVMMFLGNVEMNQDLLPPPEKQYTRQLHMAQPPKLLPAPQTEGRDAPPEPTKLPEGGIDLAALFTGVKNAVTEGVAHAVGALVPVKAPKGRTPSKKPARSSAPKKGKKSAKKVKRTR